MFVLLAGLVIPSSLIVSSVEEFSFIEVYASPFPFILHTLLQAAGIFVFWPVCIYLLSPRRTRQIISLFIILLSFAALFNVFFADENFGFLTNALIFSEPKSFAAGSMKDYLINLAILAAVTAGVLYLILTKKKMLLFSFQIITFISLLCFGILNIIKIHDGYAPLWAQGKIDNSAEIGTHYTLSKTGKNVLLVMLDAAVSGYVPYIFEEKPELLSVFNDFTWYPNCVSFANHTLIGAPPIYGGYEYTPDEINRRDSVTLAEKHREAYLLLPRLFSEAGYLVTVTDPPFSNYRMSNMDIFTEYPGIHADNIIGRHSSRWLNTHPGIQSINVTSLLRNNLIRFSIFKVMPLPLRCFIYDDGDWLTTADLHNTNSYRLTREFIDAYAHLDLLPELTSIIDTNGTYTAIYVPLPHEPTLLQPPDYIPSDIVTNSGNGRFANDGYYQVNMASFLLLEKFFRFLKDEGIYDNTRIILAADHGRGYGAYENNITLPDGSQLQSYHPLLMVKDFHSENEYFDDDLRNTDLRTEYSFMTNADVVFFALKDIMKNPVNPFTNQPLRTRKAAGADIVTIDALSSYHHSKFTYNIGKDQWLHVHDNIFDPLNWKKAKK
jgi:hypothetical protein